VQADAKRTLTTGRVVFLVIAAAAPMAAMVGNVPMALIRGDGIGLPLCSPRSVSMSPGGRVGSSRWWS
jgi:hypothetical protein